ncbi:M56 family metallopeptidase [Blautia schinkii]|nr:M56 family metallopeptidase [Blautia schinkii]
MILSYSTVLTTCLLNTILLVFLWLVLKKTKVIKHWGPKLILAILGVSVVRMFLPVEFGYTYSIYLEKYWTDVCDVLMYQIHLPGGYCIAVYQLLGLVWVAGAMLLIGKKCVAYCKASRIVGLMEEIPKDILRECVADWEEYPEFEKLKVVVCPNCDSPFLMRIFKPVVVISDRKWEKDELAYVLKHEALHYRSHDIIWKIAVDLLCTFFWWNPVFYLLKKEMFQLIEIRNDLRITKQMTGGEKIEYLNCLVSVAKSIGNKEQAFAIGFTKNNVRELKQRMELIADKGRTHWKRGILFAVFFMCLQILTTCVVIEPWYPLSEEEGILFSEKDTYLIKNGDVYDVYFFMDGEWRYIFSDANRNNFVKSIKVYEKNDSLDKQR